MIGTDLSCPTRRTWCASILIGSGFAGGIWCATRSVEQAQPWLKQKNTAFLAWDAMRILLLSWSLKSKQTGH